MSEARVLIPKEVILKIICDEINDIPRNRTEPPCAQIIHVELSNEGDVIVDINHCGISVYEPDFRRILGFLN